MTLKTLKLAVLFIGIALSAQSYAFDISERKASQLVQSKYKAKKLLKIESISSRGTKAFKIKILLDSGRLKTVYVNKKSGKISERQP
ncbi:hypothetical protein MHM98_17620 [Psychrobium sp. MM17-31]|uniref:PepSY domain-containing protein n=1 Tax=Psychrobium sp. MM17-31 TaxID=2917758 RepID=UPI001EF3EF2C|nr:hypothetical protein [Psychrobium sp. MM17-31]MCG7533150.1 hypothetical protein [Psychrobium sp. MM17-31]